MTEELQKEYNDKLNARSVTEAEYYRLFEESKVNHMDEL